MANEIVHKPKEIEKIGGVCKNYSEHGLCGIGWFTKGVVGEKSYGGPIPDVIDPTAPKKRFGPFYYLPCAFARKDKALSSDLTTQQSTCPCYTPGDLRRAGIPIWNINPHKE